MNIDCEPYALQWFTEEYDQNHFRGNVLLCCDSDNQHKVILKSKFPECNFYTTGLDAGADIVADICSSDWIKKVKAFGVKFDFVISLATLEHVIDPIGMMRNIFLLVNKCIVHSVMTHAYHLHPVDCYRFMPDWPKMTAEYFGVNIRYNHWGDHFWVFFEK